jgi:hypothetical protein
MNISRSLVGAALAAALSLSLCAQTPPSGYHSVACFKVKADKGADFHKFISDESHKVAQGRVDSGSITTWYLLRSVLSQGTATECDYLIVAMFPGAPHLLGTEQLSAAIKKAGMSIAPEDYVDHRNAVSTLVSVGIFQNAALVGGVAKKGDYFRVNYMKAPNVGDWVAYEKKVWQPFAESLAKSGAISGWSVNVRVLPGGADQPYQGVAVDVFPSLDAVFAGGAGFAEAFRKAHPDMEIGTTMEQFDRLRTIQDIQLFELEDVVTSVK